ncbi:MAG TPA: CmcI family methyltransferase [Candidatus Limnocylindrales bacterium]|nr:CmcI family methyltransferase [Candidatus Limnocylindrales bacterium]
MTHQVGDQPDRLITIGTKDGPREIDIYTPEGFQVIADLFTRSGWERRLSYEVTWLGIPIIQLPEDILMVQELIWKVRPNVIVESGVAHGGALVLYASIMELLGRGRVIGVDIEIRKYNRLAIESHPMAHRISLVEGSSTDPATFETVRTLIGPGQSTMVMLDSNHSRSHVRDELETYSPLVSPGSYIVVFDEVMPMVADAPSGQASWSRDNPLEAVTEFLATHPEFEIDRSYERLVATYCRSGFLRRLED